LTIYRDPVVANNVSRSDFRIRDLMHSDQPVTLYIVTEPVDKARLQPLVRVLVNMIVRISASGLTFENGTPNIACFSCSTNLGCQADSCNFTL
jgi:type IV secretion system protein VirD4